MNKKYNLKWLFVLLLALSMILAACAGSGLEDDKEKEGSVTSDKEKDNTEEAGQKEEEEGKSAGGDLVLAVAADASSLDPGTTNDTPSAKVQANIFETLVNRDDDNNIIPSLAESWKAIDDTTYEFKLREGVKFHDGEPFTADVVKANLERTLDPEVGSPKLFLYNMITDIDVVDNHTVRITTEYPFAPLLANLSHSGGGMVSPKSIDADYAAMTGETKAGSVISQDPIGTGYFKFDHWNPGNEIKLVKNEDYWGDNVLVDSVTFKVIPESGTRQADLERGFVHIIDPVQPMEVAGINSSDYATVIQKAAAGFSYIGFNTTKTPFENLEVRQAISMMINRDDIIAGVYDNFGIPAKSPISPGVFGYYSDAQATEYNVDEAKKLMAEAGFEDGFKTTIWTSDDQQRLDIAVLIQDILKEINIEVGIESMEFGTFLEKTADGEHEMFLNAWNNPTGDADYGIYALFHSSKQGNPGNKTFYNNAEVDKLLDEGRRESNPEERLKIYEKIQEILIVDAPMVYIHHPEFLVGVSNDIAGFSIDTSGIYHLQNVEFVK